MIAFQLFDNLTVSVEMDWGMSYIVTVKYDNVEQYYHGMTYRASRLKSYPRVFATPYSGRKAFTEAMDIAKSKGKSNVQLLHHDDGGVDYDMPIAAVHFENGVAGIVRSNHIPIVKTLQRERTRFNESSSAEFLVVSGNNVFTAGMIVYTYRDIEDRQFSFDSDYGPIKVQRETHRNTNRLKHPRNHTDAWLKEGFAVIP